MVEGRLIDCSWICCCAPLFGQPAGAVRRQQLLFVGDVFQLEPVLLAICAIYRKFYRDAFFFSAHAFDRINLVPIELRKIWSEPG